MLNRNLTIPLASLISGSIGAIPQNVKFINSLANLPAPDGDVIELPPDKLYIFCGIGMTTPYRFVCDGNLAVAGLWTYGPPQLVYTGEDTLFTVANGSFNFRELIFSAPSGQVMDVTGHPSAISGVLMRDIVCFECAKIASFTDVAVDAAGLGFLSTGDGIDISTAAAPNVVFSLRQFNFGDLKAGAVGIDLGSSTFNVFELRDCVFDSPITGGPATAISGLANNGNIVQGALAMVSGCEFGVDNGVTPFSGISIDDDDRWIARDNTRPSNTVVRALNTISNNSEPTILTENVPAPVQGTWTLSTMSQISQGTADTSQLDIDVERSLWYSIDVSATLLASGGSPRIRVSLYEDGDPIPGASSVVELPDAITEIPVSFPWLEELQSPARLEIWLTNLDDNNNVTLTNGLVRIVAK